MTTRAPAVLKNKLFVFYLEIDRSLSAFHSQSPLQYISCNIQYTQNIYLHPLVLQNISTLYFDTSDKLILKNKYSFILPYNWYFIDFPHKNCFIFWYCWYVGIAEHPLYIDTADILVSQNIFTWYWYLWYIGILYVDAYDILVLQKRSAFLPEHHPEDERRMVQPRR